MCVARRAEFCKSSISWRWLDASLSTNKVDIVPSVGAVLAQVLLPVAI
jgi:hypothetical protein